jgi:hypothetical protein
MFNIPKNFWHDMENPEFFKYVIYGDSVGGDCKIHFKYKNKFNSMDLNSIWNMLVKHNYYVVNINFKEYIFFDDNDFKILNYYLNLDKIKYKAPKYLMRHKIYDEQLIKLTFDNNRELLVTKNHSLLELDDTGLIKVSPLNVTELIGIKGGVEFNPDQQFEKVNSISPVTINSKEHIDFTGYVYDFEVANTHNFVVEDILVHNTDSLYINIPNLKPKTPQEAVEVSDNISRKINDIITDYTNDVLLKKLNVDKKHNHTDYKTELVASAMLLMDVKKNYAYKVIAEKGEVFNTPKIEYKGIPVVRIDFSKFTQEFIRRLVEDIALNEDTSINTFNALLKLTEERNSTLKQAISDLNVSYIGVPGKWKSTDYKSEPYHMTGMRLYNSISKTETFKEMSSCYSIPISLKNKVQIKNYLNKLEKNKFYLNPDIDLDKLNYLSFPYSFDKLKVLKLMNDFNLTIEFKEVWDVAFSKTLQRLCDIIKTNS